MSITKCFMLIAALALLAPGVGAQRADASSRPTSVGPGVGGTNTVTFVLVPSLRVDSAAAIVVRRAAHAPQNIVLVTRETQAADLVAALTMLNRSRRSKGDSLTLEMRALIPRANEHQASRSRNYQMAVTNLERLRTAHARPVAGVGTFPAVTATLSSVRSR